MTNKLSNFFSIRSKTKLVLLTFSLVSILGAIDASNSLDHLRLLQNIGLSIVFLSGFLDSSFAERKINSIKDLLSEREEVHIAIWWLETVGFWFFFGATILMVIRYFGVI